MWKCNLMQQNPRATVLAPACRNWLRRRRKSQRLNHQFVFGFKVLDTVSNDYQMIERHHWMMPFHCQTQPGLMANIATFVFFWHRRMNLIWWVRLSQTMRHTCGILFNYLLIFFFFAIGAVMKGGGGLSSAISDVTKRMCRRRCRVCRWRPQHRRIYWGLLMIGCVSLGVVQWPPMGKDRRGQGEGEEAEEMRAMETSSALCTRQAPPRGIPWDSLIIYFFFFLSLYHERGSDIIISIRNPTCLDVKLIQLFGLLLPVVD